MMFHKSLLSVSLCFASLFISAILFLCVGVWLARLGPPNDLLKPKPENLVIDSINIVDVLGERILANKQIVISGGVVQAILPAHTSAPEYYKRVDANGAYVTPGIIDMHTHTYDRKDLLNSLRYGVTTVRNLRGFPVHIRWREELKSQQWLGSSLITSSPILDDAHADIFQHALKNKEHARASVSHFHKAGYDLLKVYNSLPPAVLDAVIDEASTLGLAIAKHGPYGHTPSLKEPFDLTSIVGLQSVEHVEEILQTALDFDYNENRLNEYLLALKASGTPLTTTLATFEHLTKLSLHKEQFIAQIERQRINPFFKYVIEKTSIERWLTATEKQIDWNQKELDLLLRITKKASDSGIQLLVGSDQGTLYMLAGPSTHDEMRLMKEAGVSNGDILKAATINAAIALQRDTDIGSVSVGKKADLLLSRQNPLDDIQTLAQPYAVVKEGTWLSQEKLEQLSEIGEHPSSWLSGLSYLLEDLITRAFI